MSTEQAIIEIIKRPPVGRPTDYNADIAKRLCDLIATSRDGLEDICAANPDLPGASTVYAWLDRHEEFQEKYAQARANQSEVYVQDMVKIARDVIPDRDHIQKAKLEIDTLKWAASKLKPKKYGDATILRGDKDNPIELSLASALDAINGRRQDLPAIDGECVRIEPSQPEAITLPEITERTTDDPGE